jgi:hypothetical protein
MALCPRLVQMSLNLHFVVKEFPALRTVCLFVLHRGGCEFSLRRFCNNVVPHSNVHVSHRCHFERVRHASHLMQNQRLLQSCPSKPTRSPPILHPARRSHRSLRKLPSVSAPVSFQRLLQVKFQSPRVRTELDGKQKAAIESSEDTSFDTESNSDSSNSMQKGSTASTSQLNRPGVDSEGLLCGSYLISYAQLDVDGLPTAINSQKEASIRLAAAGARKKVIRAEHRLRLYIAQEHTILGQLYQELAEQAGKQARAADIGIDHVRDAIQNRGFHCHALVAD